MNLNRDHETKIWYVFDFRFKISDMCSLWGQPPAYFGLDRRSINFLI